MAAYLYSDGFTLGFLPCRDNLRRLELQHSRAIWQIDTSVLYARRPTVMESYIWLLDPTGKIHPKKYAARLAR